LIGRTECAQDATFQLHRLITQCIYHPHIVTYEQDSPSTATNFFHFSQAFFLKLRIADSQHFVHYQYFNIKVGGDCKCEPHIHSAAVTLYWSINKSLYISKCNDFIKFSADFTACHSEDGTIEEDVLAPRQLSVKPGPHFQQTRYATGNPDTTFCQ